MTDSSQPVNPSDLIPESWVMKTMTTGNGGLVVQHEFDEPSELAVPALTHHLIGVNIGQQGSRQVTRLGKQEYDGIAPTGSLWLATADNTSAEWAWETIDETILFQIDPLRQKDAAIIDIALACGFADQSHLTKHFRKFVGMTPKAFREH